MSPGDAASTAAWIVVVTTTTPEAANVAGPVTMPASTAIRMVEPMIFGRLIESSIPLRADTCPRRHTPVRRDALKVSGTAERFDEPFRSAGDLHG